MKMGDVLLVDSSRAEIRTATVTIKTLRIENRQLTKAVFWQLPETKLLDLSTLEICGAIWGWVNTEPGGESCRRKQFVIEVNGVLYRAPWSTQSLERALLGVDLTKQERADLVSAIEDGGQEWIESYCELMDWLDLSVEQLYIAA